MSVETKTQRPQDEADLLPTALDVPVYKPESRRALRLGLTAITLIVLAAILVPLYGVRDKQAQFHQTLERRLAILAEGRAQVVGTWLDGLLQLTARVTQAEMFRLFVTEADLAATQDDADLRASVTEQVPLVQAVLREYAEGAGFTAAALIDRHGAPLVSAGTVPAAGLAAKVFDGGKPAFGPVRAAAQGLVLDLYLPLLPPQAEPAAKTSGVLLLSLPVTARLAEFLAPSPLFMAGERFRLVQTAGAPAEIRPGEREPIRSLPAFDAAFGVRDGVYSLAVAVPALGWAVVQEADAESARADLVAYTRAAIGVAALVVITVVVAFGAFWWRVSSLHNRSMAEQFRDLANRINAHRRLLNTITSSIQEWIGLKGPDGTYVYVNPAFAEAVQRPMDKIIGLDDEALFGHGTAERLRAADRQALTAGRALTIDDRIYLAGQPHYVQISKVALRDENGMDTGIVSVTRDVTEVVLQQQKREKAVKQMVVALVRAVELRDPYLGGHSRRVAGLSAAIARHLGAEPAVLATVEVAANLSQIGKLSISRALLNKPGRLTPEEQKVVQGHVDHAAQVLREIDFELPVFQAIREMNERLDGTGYPEGIGGERISLAGRILGVCDVFCARIAPRAYRPPISAAETLAILRDNTSRYDPQVVDALAAVLETIEGQGLLREMQ